MLDQRPVHIVTVGGETTATPVTDEEWAEMRAREQAAAEAQLAADSAQQADLAAVAERAAQDPAYAALVRLIGIRLPEGEPR